MGTGALMGTITATVMRNPNLILAQWMSPSFPVGAFAYSHGLETAIADGRVADAGTLQDWLEDIATFGSGQSDLVLLAAAYRGDTQAAEAMAQAIAPSLERLQETQRQGRAFCDAVNAVWLLALPDLCYPVAVGAAAARLELPIALTARFYLHAFLSNLTSAAVRLVPLGQTDGQRVIDELAPHVEETARTALATPLASISGASFAADIASMQHECLNTRIFRT